MKKFIAILVLSIFWGCSSTPAPSGRGSSGARIQQKTTGQTQSTCYQFGYRWGVCAAKNTAGQTCSPETDATIPEHCLNKAETERGIKDGLLNTQRRIGPTQ